MAGPRKLVAIKMKRGVSALIGHPSVLCGPPSNEKSYMGGQEPQVVGEVASALASPTPPLHTRES